MTKAYENTLKQAQRELEECNEAISILERKRANLMQIITSLQAKLGGDIEIPKTLTDAILLVVMGTRERESIRAVDVVSRLKEMQIPASPRSVATILSRLAREGRLYSWKGPNGEIGYEWKGVRTKSDALNATRMLAEAGKRNMTK